MGSSRTGLDLGDSSRTKFCGLGLDHVVLEHIPDGNPIIQVYGTILGDKIYCGPKGQVCGSIGTLATPVVHQCQYRYHKDNKVTK